MDKPIVQLAGILLLLDSGSIRMRSLINWSRLTSEPVIGVSHLRNTEKQIESHAGFIK